jgi:hypothetical protein
VARTSSYGESSSGPFRLGNAGVPYRRPIVRVAKFGFRKGANSHFWVSVPLLVSITAAVPHSASAQAPGSPREERRTKPIKPPHEPVQQGFRFVAMAGLSFIQNRGYTYNTNVSTPNLGTLSYAGAQRSSGATLFVGAAATPRGTLRRFTLGCDLNLGGLAVWSQSVIPSGTATPFSQSNLNAQVSHKSLVTSPWRPFLSPYVEHELASVFQNRVRIGYQYMQSSGSLRGIFATDQSGTMQARYAVRFSQHSHMFRMSLHNDTWFDNNDPGQVPPKRRSGALQQLGLLVGTDGSFVVFLAAGPVWTF